MLIQRILEQRIRDHMFEGKIIVVYGARQVGKTTLLHQLEQHFANRRSLWLNCDDPADREMLRDATTTSLRLALGDAELVFIDEAQRVTNIGLTLKMAIDTLPHIQLVVSGSSSFDLANKINEPLTGRKYEFMLYPFSWDEISRDVSFLERQRLLPLWLRYGTYPSIVTNPGRADFSLHSMVRGTLYKDVLEHQSLRNAELLEKLLKALAYQMGNEVSYNELARLLGASAETVSRYLQLLEQSFIVFRVGPYSHNLRTELRNTRKVYFYDLGIRNALINKFDSVELRDDVGALWENAMIVERRKLLGNTGVFGDQYFWRTHEQQEIDYIESLNAHVAAYEFKWNAKQRCRAPKAFREGYPDASFECITPETYASFVGITNN